MTLEAAAWKHLKGEASRSSWGGYLLAAQCVPASGKEWLLWALSTAPCCSQTYSQALPVPGALLPVLGMAAGQVLRKPSSCPAWTDCAGG